MRKHSLLILELALAIAASASTWFYMDWILRSQQQADAAAHNRPRGNLSDLYPRWLGARELLRHGRNPYSAEITREIQQGYYGRPLDVTRADDPKDQQAFAYPVYVVFLMAPTADLSFGVVQQGFRWLLVGLAVVTVFVWLYVLRWNPRWEITAILVVLMLGAVPMVQGLKLQQLSLLVAGLLAGCAACLVSGWLALAGAVLALATIKPQLTLPLVLWLGVWAGSDWRSRWRFLLGFGISMLLLLGGAQIILPGWLPMFIAGLRPYHEYTQSQSVLTSLFGLVFGRLIGAACIVSCALCVWRLRRKPACDADFGNSIGLILALTIVIIPMSSLYNQVLLAPAIFGLLKSGSSGEAILPAVRRVRAAGYFVLSWPWIATIALSLLYPWMTPDLRQRLWSLPLYSSLMVPVFVFGLALLNSWRSEPDCLPDGTAAE